MDPFVVIARNSSGPGYDKKSFIGSLHEYGKWNTEEYWLFERALHDLCSLIPYSPQLMCQVFHDYSHLAMLFGCHLDPNDSFCIDLSDEEVYAWRERTRYMFEGFFSGALPDEKLFDHTNPLLDPSHQTP